MPDEAEDLNQELDDGRKAAELVARHMERMCAAETEWLIPSEHGMWKVSVELYFGWVSRRLTMPKIEKLEVKEVQLFTDPNTLDKVVLYADAVAREDALIEAMKKAMSDMYDVIRRIKETRTKG